MKGVGGSGSQPGLRPARGSPALRARPGGEQPRGRGRASPALRAERSGEVPVPVPVSGVSASRCHKPGAGTAATPRGSWAEEPRGVRDSL